MPGLLIVQQFQDVDAQGAPRVTLAKKGGLCKVIWRVAVVSGHFGLSALLGRSEVLRHGVDQTAHAAEKFT